MKIVIELETDNAAFEDDFRFELKQTLNQAFNKILSQRKRKPGCICKAPESIDKLLDTNGNTVGSVRVQ